MYVKIYFVNIGYQEVKPKKKHAHLIEQISLSEVLLIIYPKTELQKSTIFIIGIQVHSPLSRNTKEFSSCKYRLIKNREMLYVPLSQHI